MCKENREPESVVRDPLSVAEDNRPRVMDDGLQTNLRAVDMNKRILFVEDEPGLVMTLTDRLRSEGYIVETAIDGEAGLARAASESFDAIILDIMLPRKSGFDV